MKNNKQTKLKNLKADFVASVVGVARLAFITSQGVAGYVLIFSTNSLTLNIVAGVLVFKTGLDAVNLSIPKSE